MSFIYLPSVAVQPYKVFGVNVFAVESVGADYETGRVYRIQHEWSFCLATSKYNADKLINGEP